MTYYEIIQEIKKNKIYLIATRVVSAVIPPHVMPYYLVPQLVVLQTI